MATRTTTKRRRLSNGCVEVIKTIITTTSGRRSVRVLRTIEC